MRTSSLGGTARTIILMAGFLSPPLTIADEMATDRPAGQFETVATFHGPMPTGVTALRGGRIFVNFPKWGDKVDFTVAELKQGRAVAYPDAATNGAEEGQAATRLISVQSVVVDPLDRLWIVDAGSIEFVPTSPGGPKLVGVDLATNKAFKVITFPENVALSTTDLNDVRFDLRRGEAERVGSAVLGGTLLALGLARRSIGGAAAAVAGGGLESPTTSGATRRSGRGSWRISRKVTPAGEVRPDGLEGCRASSQPASSR